MGADNLLHTTRAEPKSQSAYYSHKIKRMNKTVLITSILAILLVLGVGYLAVNTDDNTPTDRASGTNAEEQEASAESDTTNQDATADAVSPPAQPTTESGVYAPYDAARVATSDADHILLFFHAPWCPSCRALDADITAGASTIPADVAIFQVDYDTATELKRRYGVTTQHSVIAIDASGNAQSDITHPRTLEDVLGTL
jgi:thiol-disulfide isomerase/thioredoxin